MGRINLPLYCNDTGGCIVDSSTENIFLTDSAIVGGKHITAYIPIETLLARRILLPDFEISIEDGIAFCADPDAETLAKVTESGWNLALALIEEYPEQLGSQDAAEICSSISARYLQAWGEQTDLDLRDYF